MDDGSIVGKIEDLNAIAAKLDELFRSIGLSMNYPKCHIMTESRCLMMYPYLNRMQHHLTDSEDGLKVLGTPIGGGEYVNTVLSECLANVNAFLFWTMSCCAFASSNSARFCRQFSTSH